MTAAEPAPPAQAAPRSTATPGVGQLRMRPVEAALFRAQMTPPPGCYLEWGLGGSTAEALRAGAGLVVSVEGDAAWIAGARRDGVVAAAQAEGRLRLVHADIGPTGDWGTPTDPPARHSGPAMPRRPGRSWRRPGHGRMWSWSMAASASRAAWSWRARRWRIPGGPRRG